jgi:hypothetical protein
MGFAEPSAICGMPDPASNKVRIRGEAMLTLLLFVLLLLLLLLCLH